MKSIVIPDIHCKWQKADSIVKRFSDADEIITVGDYFDDFGDSPKLNSRTAQWLKEFMEEKNHIALVGNHEMNYIFHNGVDKCSGYSSHKKWRINQIMKASDWRKLIPYYVTQGWHITHAGITMKLACNPVTLEFNSDEFTDRVNEEYKRFLSCMEKPPLFMAGAARGGRAAFGGITWCDFKLEFEPIEGINQIFGHTPSHKPINIETNWCIDTGLNHVALIVDGEVEILEV